MLKIFWEFINRDEFIYKYFFPAISITFFVMTAAHLHIQIIDTEDLVMEEGFVSYINEEMSQGPKTRSYPLKIRFKENVKDYQLIDHFKDQFSFIKTTVHVGDKITIYTSSSIFNLARLSRDNVIYQINKGEQTVFSLKDMKSFKLGQIKHFLSLALFILLFNFIVRRVVEKRASKEKAANI